MSAKYDDAMGNELKAYEAVETERRVNPGECVVVRVDGMSFSKFTASMIKPYDSVMGECMKATASKLLEYFKAEFSYTQSDEITLVFSPAEEMHFDGRLQKMATACASKATAFFINELTKRTFDQVEDIGAKMDSTPNMTTVRMLLDRISTLAPAFDGRAISAPRNVAASFLVWRELDGRRNAALGAGRAEFEQKDLSGKSPADIKDMLLDVGVDFYEAYPLHFARGTLLRKRLVEMQLTEDELARIPEHIRESKRGEVYKRSRIVEVENYPPFYAIENIADFLFDDAVPVAEVRPFANHITP